MSKLVGDCVSFHNNNIFIQSGSHYDLFADNGMLAAEYYKNSPKSLDAAYTLYEQAGNLSEYLARELKDRGIITKKKYTKLIAQTLEGQRKLASGTLPRGSDPPPAKWEGTTEVSLERILRESIAEINKYRKAQGSLRLKWIQTNFLPILNTVAMKTEEMKRVNICWMCSVLFLKHVMPRIEREVGKLSVSELKAELCPRKTTILGHVTAMQLWNAWMDKKNSEWNIATLEGKTACQTCRELKTCVCETIALKDKLAATIWTTVWKPEMDDNKWKIFETAFTSFPAETRSAVNNTKILTKIKSETVKNGLSAWLLKKWFRTVLKYKISEMWEGSTEFLALLTNGGGHSDLKLEGSLRPLPLKLKGSQKSWESRRDEELVAFYSTKPRQVRSLSTIEAIFYLIVEIKANEWTREGAYISIISPRLAILYYCKDFQHFLKKAKKAEKAAQEAMMTSKAGSSDGEGDFLLESDEEEAAMSENVKTFTKPLLNKFEELVNEVQGDRKELLLAEFNKVVCDIFIKGNTYIPFINQHYEEWIAQQKGSLSDRCEINRIENNVKLGLIQPKQDTSKEDRHRVFKVGERVKWQAGGDGDSPWVSGTIMRVNEVEGGENTFNIRYNRHKQQYVNNRQQVYKKSRYDTDRAWYGRDFEGGEYATEVFLHDFQYDEAASNIVMETDDFAPWGETTDNYTRLSNIIRKPSDGKRYTHLRHQPRYSNWKMGYILKRDGTPLLKRTNELAFCETFKRIVCIDHTYIQTDGEDLNILKTVAHEFGHAISMFGQHALEGLFRPWARYFGDPMPRVTDKRPFNCLFSSPRVIERQTVPSKKLLLRF